MIPSLRSNALLLYSALFRKSRNEIVRTDSLRAIPLLTWSQEGLWEVDRTTTQPQCGLIVKSRNHRMSGLELKKKKTIVRCVSFGFQRGPVSVLKIWLGRTPSRQYYLCQPQPSSYHFQRKIWTNSEGLPQHIPSSNLNRRYIEVLIEGFSVSQFRLLIALVTWTNIGSHWGGERSLYSEKRLNARVCVEQNLSSMNSGTNHQH